MDFMDASRPGRARTLVGHQPDLSIPWSRKRRRYRRIFERLAEHYTLATLAEGVAALD